MASTVAKPPRVMGHPSLSTEAMGPLPAAPPPSPAVASMPPAPPPGAPLAPPRPPLLDPASPPAPPAAGPPPVLAAPLPAVPPAADAPPVPAPPVAVSPPDALTPPVALVPPEAAGTPPDPALGASGSALQAAPMAIRRGRGARWVVRMLHGLLRRAATRQKSCGRKPPFVRTG